EAIRVALDALDDYMSGAIRDAKDTYAALESRFLASNLAEFGGKLPSMLPKAQMPARFLTTFSDELRNNPQWAGLQDKEAAERFLAGIGSFDMNASYEIYYMGYTTDAAGNRRAANGYSVEVSRH